MNYKSDGSEWYNYFFIRLDPSIGYYFAWIGSKRIAFPNIYFKCSSNARTWMKAHTEDWRRVVDEEFEKEVLDGPERC